MRTEQIDNLNIQGKLIIINDLSHKPHSCIKKVEENLRKLIKPKNYDLYIEQDYSHNKIRVAASSIYPSSIYGVLAHEELPITANSQRYMYAAKNAIDNHENSLKEFEQKKWESEKRKQRLYEIKEIAGSIVFLPLFAINDILHSINPKWSSKFEKLIDKII